MTTLAPVTAPVAAQTAHQQDQRAPLDYGAAVTHLDIVREKLRVDPTSLAHKKRAHTEPRAGDDAPERPDHRGQYVDIEV
jgi:hypothetical protein